VRGEETSSSRSLRGPNRNNALFSEQQAIERSGRVMGTELDMLAIGNCILCKEEQLPSLGRL
jgi:hypothetical protein